jgi:hypothetical protein
MLLKTNVLSVHTMAGPPNMFELWYLVGGRGQGAYINKEGRMIIWCTMVERLGIDIKVQTFGIMFSRLG